MLNMGKYRAKMPGPDSPPCHSIFVGHNPSLQTWETGHYYANPSNRFWKLLGESGIIDGEDPKLDDILVDDFGFGFCDVIETPGNDANTISRQEFKGDAALFLKRIENYALSMNGSLKRICFVGKRQWKQLFTPILARCDHGKQSNEHRPRNWPVSLIGVDVWILPSPSGRAVLSNEERGAPYRDLASEIDDI